MYTFLAYTTGAPPKPDVDRFGFVAQRKQDDGSILTYIVFRGTREPEEWFNNFQFKQVPFLMQSQEDESSPIRISLGFNKMYTDYRPGLFIEHDAANRYSRWIDEQFTEASRKRFPDEHRLHSESIMETIDHFLETYDLESSKIYVTGHSLGAALASIAALHISQALQKKEQQAQLVLYTFASPRVGNKCFAEECAKMFTCFRIANSEDIVTTLPPPTFRLIGEEMLPSPLVEQFRRLASSLSGGISEDINDHIGTNIYFTVQLGEVSSNHNMSVTYCHALSRISMQG